MSKKLCDVVVGKTVWGVTYLDHERIGIAFTDGTYLRIEQPSQSGALYVHYLDDLVAHEVDADDKENDDE